MKGYILYQTYKIINNKPTVLLFGKLENSQSFLTLNSYTPYFYIKASDAKHLPKDYSSKPSKFKNFKSKKLVQVLMDVPADAPKLRKYLEKEDVECYEADIKFPQRFLIDNKIKTFIEIPDGDYEDSDVIDRIYQEPTLSPAEPFSPNLKVFSIDIETSKNAEDLYSLSIYSKKFQTSLLISKKKIPNTLSFTNESDLLEKFQEIILDEDPDVLTGWNFIDFDLNFLKEKFKEHKIPFVLGRTEQQCKVQIEQDFFRTSKADFQGRIALDAIDLLKGSFIQLENYKLSTAAHHFLKEKKLIDDYNKGEEIETLFKKDPKKLIAYNLKDSKLVIDILDKTKVLDLTIHRSILTGMTLDRVNASIASFDSLYLRKLRENQIAAPSSTFQIKKTSILGGYVRDSLPGIYENIVVLDFKSLYPSIIRTFNIDPLAFVGKKKGKDYIVAPNKAAFKREGALLPEIIEFLMKEREKVAKQKDELTRYAIKILLNSFFGVMANPSFRFFNTDMANAITHFGQHLIKLTAKKIEEKGYKVIYSDTDSVFVYPKMSSLKQTENLGEKLVKNTNSFFDKYVKDKYKRENHLELEFEKVFKMFLMPHVRGSETGAKKRYAGLLIKDGKEKIEFTGLESRRRDWTDLSKKFQNELLDLIFHKKPVTNYIKKFVEDTQKGKYDDLLIYRKSLRKNLEDYTKITPPHVKAARKLAKVDSNIIEYVITEDGPEPLQNLKHKRDYGHYIKKQIQPIADSVLVFFDKTFEELLKGSKQSSLSSF